jgi:hypothetical protein
MTTAVQMTKEVREYLDRKEARPFCESHPFVIEVDDGLPPLRFASLRCAARTAVERKTGVWDESQGKGYDAADCIKISAGGWPYA